MNIDKVENMIKLIIRRKVDAGLIVGNLPSGEVSPDELMERIRIEEFIKMIQSDIVNVII